MQKTLVHLLIQGLDFAIAFPISPFMPYANGISHLYQLNESVPILRSLNFIQSLKVHPASKQCRTRSDAAFCGVWSGSTLFVGVP